MKVVTFLRPALPYLAGESAAFDDDYADRLIAMGIAREATRADAPKSVQPEKERMVRHYVRKG